MRLRRLLCGVVLLAAVGGCTSSPDRPPPAPASPPAWSEPADYGFVLQRQCPGGPALGRYRVTVKAGEVAEAERIDGRTASGEEEIDVLTLGDMLELARTATDDGAAATTTFDPGDGHPTAVTVDRTEGDVTCFTVTEYAAA